MAVALVERVFRFVAQAGKGSCGCRESFRCLYEIYEVPDSGWRRRTGFAPCARLTAERVGGASSKTVRGWPGAPIVPITPVHSIRGSSVTASTQAVPQDDRGIHGDDRGVATLGGDQLSGDIAAAHILCQCAAQRWPLIVWVTRLVEAKVGRRPQSVNAPITGFDGGLRRFAYRSLGRGLALLRLSVRWPPRIAAQALSINWSQQVTVDRQALHL
jgi:hypothetical protein